MRTSRIPAFVATVALLVLAAPAAAAPQVQTFRYGPVSVGPYQVKQSDYAIDVPKPVEDGYITRMEVDVVDANGKSVPISRLMLHHIVFSNIGENFGSKHDSTCDTFTTLDSKSVIPAIAERFYAIGEERAEMRLPEGYGYPVKGRDKWALTYMMMNHRNRTDKAFIQYRITYDKAKKTPVKPYWLDARNCLSDPVYDVPGGGARGSTHTKSTTWTVPENAKIVAGGGHVHGGAKSLALNRGSCKLYASKPTWGLPSHPFYNVKPVLHEPGPINMSGFLTGEGFAVRRGQKLRLDSNYDAQLIHTRVMGIMIVYAAQGSGSGASGCREPSDLSEYRTNRRGRRKPPRFEVPIVGVRDGRATNIPQPPGSRRRLASGSTIGVGDRFFRTPNSAVRAGAMLRWKFDTQELHDITVASGPRGFSSKHLNGGRVYAHKLQTPGNYKLFCSLHPVEMTATVKVTK